MEPIVLIKSVSEVLKIAAEAMSKVGDSLAHLTRIGVQGYDALAARRAHSQLSGLRVSLGILYGASNIRIVRSIDEYIDLARSSRLDDASRQWNAVVHLLTETTTRVEDLLTEVNKIRNDFVLEEAYSTIQRSLYGRLSLFEKLKALPAPLAGDTLEALAHVAAEYRRLMEATDNASEQLAAYIKTIK